MSALVLGERPMRLWDDENVPRRTAPTADSPASRADLGVRGELTLADVVASAWEGLSARITVACPVCHGELEPRQAAGGRCRSCGTSLS